MTSELPEVSILERDLGDRAAAITPAIFRRTRDLDEAIVEAFETAGDELIRGGSDEAEVRRIVEKFVSGRGFPKGEVRSFADNLHSALMSSFEEYLAAIPEEAVRLDEVKVTAKTGFKMFFYPNESQHAGFPHLTALLRGNKINISLEEEPRIVAGKRNLPGEAAVLRAVKEHRTALLKQWHETRPDDQKIPPKLNTQPGQEGP